jgi:cytoplasmic iron level regulating protein YaaA (DUF328/UPF0246 family)
MKILVSPAKKLDLSDENYSLESTDSIFLKQSETIMNSLSSLSVLEISKLMKLSNNLSILNYERNKNWKLPISKKEGKQALLSFKGEVYQSMRIGEFNTSDFEFANQNLRILSGLYGILRPSDLILPYRLEMGTKLQIGKDKNLYSFWKEILTNHLLEELKQEPFLVNLASDEYFKVIDKNKIPIPVITPIFKDTKNGKVKVISFFAKKARGEMCNFIITNKIKSVEQLKLFNNNNYQFSNKESTDLNLVFIR